MVQRYKKRGKERRFSSIFEKKNGKYFGNLLKISNFAVRNPRDSDFHIINIYKYRNMTKAEIINKIAEETGVAKRDVATSVEAFMEVIRQSLAEDKENVYLRGFGTFVVKRRARKTARNISKNTTLVIEAHDFPAFKPSKSFIEKMK